MGGPPNFEFATVFVGVIGVLYFGQSFRAAALAIVLGTALGSVSHGVLSSWGPRAGRPQMVLGRSAFGFWGNLLPSGLMSITAGIGWFAVNSVSGAYALASLTHLPKGLSLLIVVALQMAVAFFGHNLVHVFERFAFPFLVVVFLVTTVVVFSKSHPGAGAAHGTHTVAAFLIELGATFGYACGWNPYASDYTRYLKPGVSTRTVGLFAGLGVFLSCTVLELAGAASVTIGTKATANPTADFTGNLATWLADLTLLAIVLGAVSANVLNIYSGSMAFLTMGIKLPFGLRRALVAIVFGLIGLLVAFTGLSDAGEKYNNFLLVIAYWIAPWLAVVFVDRVLRRGRDTGFLLDDRSYVNVAGPIAMVVGIVVSIIFFSNQTEYVGIVPKRYPGVGDITFEVGFVLAAVLYLVLVKLVRPIERVPAFSDADLG